MEEIWKDIYGYEGLYQVSNLGRVRSLPRNGTVNEIKILKPSNRGNGYLFIVLCKDGKHKNKLIHRLVAQAFIPNDDLFKTEVNHKDENKQNNIWSNLEYCDRAYNNIYGSRLERCSKTSINHPNLSKPVQQYSLDGHFIQSFPSAMEIQRLLGYNVSNICHCCNGKLKTAYGFIWKYKNEEQS